jgi:hypothetical protein
MRAPTRFAPPTPTGINEMAIRSVGEFANGKGYDTITRYALEQQIAKIGIDLNLLGN